MLRLNMCLNVAYEKKSCFNALYTQSNIYLSPWRSVKYYNQHVCMSLCQLTYFKNYIPNVIVFCTCCLWPWLGRPLTTLHILCTSTFVDDVMFSLNGAYLVHGEAYGQGMLVSRRQCGDWHSTSSPPLSALTTADWHPSAVSLVVHNGVGCGCEQCIAGGEQSLLS